MSIRDLQPIRRGADIFVTINGEEVKLSHAQAALVARAWFEATSGAYMATTHSAIDLS